MPHKTKYIKRYDATGRQLCYGDSNTCNNLAGYKQTINGKRIYHNECDRHRRHGHGIVKNKFRHRKSYLTIDKCEDCGSKAVHRHRLQRALGYIKSNVVGLCLSCHKKAHLPK